MSLLEQVMTDDLAMSSNTFKVIKIQKINWMFYNSYIKWHNKRHIENVIDGLQIATQWSLLVIIIK